MREDRKRLFSFLIRKRGISQLQFLLTSLKHINSNIRLYMLSAGARVYRHSTIGIYNSNEFYLTNDNVNSVSHQIRHWRQTDGLL